MSQSFAQERWNSQRIPVAVAGLLFIHAALVAYWAWCHSPTWDEVATLPGGIRIWREGRFDVYTVNPPLVKLVAALPIAWTSAKCDWGPLDSPNDLRSEFAVGRRFVELNGQAAFTYYTFARWACIPFSVLGGLVCFVYARALYGVASGFLALILWCFCPNILGYGALISPDAAAASLGLATVFVFWRWLREPTWGRALALGGVLGLAELTKLTWLVFYFLLPILWLVHMVAARFDVATQKKRPPLRQLAAALALSVYAINLGYFFEGTCIPLGQYRFMSTALGGERERGEFGQRLYDNRFRDTWWGAIPVPLPANYVIGADVQKLDFETGITSYFRGEWRGRGWWYYYLYAMGVKMPLGTLLLILGSAVVPVIRRAYASHWRDELIVLLPALTIITVVSSHTAFNHHVRYVLPAFPFLFVWASKLARFRPLGHRAVQCSVLGLVLWSVGGSLATFPHNLSYFNELVGGPQNGHWHLGHSNTDWGQDLFFIEKWRDNHDEVPSWYLAYDLPLVDPKVLHIDYDRPPFDPRSKSVGADIDKAVLGPRPGWYAVSVNQLHSRLHDYDYLLGIRPVDWIGYTTPVYHLSLDEANRLRAELGLPTLSGAER